MGLLDLFTGGRLTDEQKMAAVVNEVERSTGGRIVSGKFHPAERPGSLRVDYQERYPVGAEEAMRARGLQATGRFKSLWIWKK